MATETVEHRTSPKHRNTGLIPRAEDEPTVGLDIACPALGIRPTKGYELARTGQLAEGVPVIRVGAKYRVVTAALRRALLLDA